MSEFDIDAFLDSKGKNANTKDVADPATEIIAESGSEVNGSKQSDENSKNPDKDAARRRSKDRDNDRDKDKDRDRKRSSRSRDRDRDRDRKRSRERRRSRSRDRDRRRSRSRDRDRRRSRSRDRERKRSRSRDRGERDRERDRVVVSEPTEAERAEIQRIKEIENLTKDQRTVFVGQLTAKVNENIVRVFFEQIGKVNNVIMIRDKASGKHKGFAYVEMKDLETIENCLLFNNVVPDFQKFPIQVKASEAEKNFLASKEKAMLREGGNAPDSRVYIGNLHPSVSDTDINAILSQFGPVDYVNLHRDEMGNSKCFAFARFTRADDAKIAMEKLTGLDIGGKLIKVGPVIDPKANNNSSSTTTNAVATANVPSAIDASLNYQNNTNSWKLDDDEGTGMQMNSQSRAMLMAKLGQAAGISVPTPILPSMPTPVPIVPQIPSITGAPSRCFMIRNMFDIEEEKRNGAGWDLDIKEDVSEECGKFGPVEHCFVENVKPGGMVYVKFASVDASINAAVSLNGRYFAGRMITVTYIELTQYNSIFTK